jgi:hypothetical protein
VQRSTLHHPLSGHSSQPDTTNSQPGILAAAQSAAAVRANQNGTAAADIAVKGVISNTTGAGIGVQGTSPKGTVVSGTSPAGPDASAHEAG